jgi:rhodanese-related sulfurtransferase
MMKAFLGIGFRALIILLFWSSLGLGINLISSKSIPWVYEPPPDLTISGIKVPLVDEKEALTYLDDPATTFVDTRKAEHYEEGHVKGSVSLPAREAEERFPLVQPLLPEENRIVLYCYGPECEDAEHVAEFLAQLGYKKMAIMSPGFPQWKKAGYPMETRGAADPSRAERDTGPGRGQDSARPGSDSPNQPSEAQRK